MFHDRVRYHNGVRLPQSRDRRDAAERQEVVGWMLMAVLASANILSFSLLWFKADGGCARHHTLCQSAPHALTGMTATPSSEGALESVPLSFPYPYI